MKLSHLLIAIIALAFGSMTFANTNMNNQNGRLYGGFDLTTGGINSPTINQEVTFQSNTFSVKDDDIHQGFGWHVFGGYLFQMSDRLWLGPELGYARPSDNVYKVTAGSGTVATGANITYSDSILSVLASGRLHIFSNFDLIGKFGLASLTQTIDVPVLGKEEGQAVAPEFVVGAGYNATKNISLNVTYDSILTDGMTKRDFLDNDALATVYMVNFGMAYTF